jgi:hypothetical protein
VDAIADYSVHFPRIITLKIDCTASTHAYDMPADCKAVLSVEYPKGEDPPKYLRLSDRFASGFYDSDTLVDVQFSDDADDPGQLWISADPLVAEDINLVY